MMISLSWDMLSLIYTQEESCTYFVEELDTLTTSTNKIRIAFKKPITNFINDDVTFILDQIKLNSRIVILCMEDMNIYRNFADAAHKAGMDNDEYVYILRTTVKRLADLETNPIYGNDPSAKLFASKTFLASDYAPTLHDSIYLYAVALSNAINKSGNSDVVYNGTYVGANNDFQAVSGVNGNIKMGRDGFRKANYLISSYNDAGKLVSYLSFQLYQHVDNITGNTIDDVNATKLFTDPTTSIWANHGGVQPTSTPKCGFDGLGCPIDAFIEYRGVFIAVIIVGCAIAIGLMYGAYMIYRVKRRNLIQQNLLWQIDFANLKFLATKKETESTRSMRSLQSSMHSLRSASNTSSSQYSIASKNSQSLPIYIYRQEKVIGIKHEATTRLDESDMAELRQMRSLDHDNINRFIGLSIDGPAIISVWKYCSRGNLQDIMSNSTITMDGFFIYSIIRDLAEGLNYIHKSFIGVHGNLKSKNCLVDDRWQVKISEFGLTGIRRVEKRSAADRLWTAPELLRMDSRLGTQPADVYSFAIICSEVVNMKKAWETSDRAEYDPEEIIRLVQKDSRRPFRPVIQPVATDMSSAMLHIIKDSWSDDPSERPKIETIKNLLQSMNTSKSTNLLDHVFNLLEQYAVSLEDEVQQRTQELNEEKKKSDILLYRMLPKQVADKLKLGQSIEPETFDCVTIFFSDVVSFTTLASRCSPLQVVNMLNDLYSVFDGIISEHDVYKVETIGDGYLCVSGLPHRNGNDHARNIANMSLAFLKSLDRFSIPHLPGERINLRIGVHTGGVVAGVVGLSMPRYCLFGDSVNTASRMESSGKPGKIQLSYAANHFLTNFVGGYVTQLRGEVIIKGKGVMETHWLLGLESDPNVQRMLREMEKDFHEQAGPIDL
uniref:Guanylate cyclase n=1 Tax=Acrobeloides nanus TaxID=290746 RepID=A0A914C358_9BILA